MGLRRLVIGLIFALAFGSAVCAADGVSPSEIHLGQACATKGPAKALGRGMRSGLEVYFQQLNDQGGIDGRQIRLTTINDSYEPTKSEMATRMLIEKKDIFLMIGGVGTPTAKVTVPVCEEHQVPFIAPFTGAEFLRNPYRRYVVNLRGSYFQEMEVLAEYLVDKQGLERIACFYQNDGYGQAGLAGIVKALERRGMKLVGAGTYERNTVAIATGLNDIAELKPQAVVMVGANMPCAMFIKQAKKQPVFDRTLFCNISFVGTEALLANLGQASEGCIVSQVVPFPWDGSIPVVAEFQQAMRDADRADEIGFVTLEGYLAAKLFHEVVQRVDGELTRESFIEAVDASGAIDLGGITVTFGADDHQGMDEVFLTQFRGGQVVRLEN